MAKSTSKRSAVTTSSPGKSAKSFISVDKKAFDPTLASLFASSLGPVEAPSKSRYESLIEKPPAEGLAGEEEEEDDEELSSGSDNGQLESDDEKQEDDEGREVSDDSANDSSDDGESDSEQSPSDNEVVLAKLRESLVNGAQDKPNKKRKRGAKEEDVENAYMQKLAREEAKEEEKRKKKQKTEPVQEGVDKDDVSDKSQESDEESFTIPKHETLMEAEDDNAEDIEKAQRTVFLGNVSSDAITSKSAQKTLMKHLASFISDLADNKPPHKVESIRYRSTAFASALPKRAAFAKREIMDSTTKSTNAYVVYSTQVAAREAAKRLNGTVVLQRHLRVDSVAHPSKVDHRRCVFVGNLGFVDDESKMNTEEDSKKKSKPPADVEEGLWVHFAKAGKVESVRVIRDSQTRVGKGFAYVQFKDENAVEAALQLNEQKFPPMLPRKLRVARCKAEKKKDKKRGPPPSKSPTTKGKGVYNAKVSDEQKSKQGRARSMLGKAGAVRSMESFVFEGHRASSKQGHSGLKLGGKKKGPNGRKKRSAAWKAGGKR